MSKKLSKLIKQANINGELPPYLIPILEQIILEQTQEFEKINHHLITIQNNQSAQKELINIIACNLNPIFAIESQDDAASY